MAARPSPGTASVRRALVLPAAASWGAWLLALGLPILFLHVDHQPVLSLPAGSTELDVALSDLVVLAIVVAAGAVLRERAARLRPGLPLWVAAASLLALVAVGTVVPILVDPAYAAAENAVTALKFGEYVLLAPAVAVLVRRVSDARVVLASVAAWSAFCALVALAQFVGVVDAYGKRDPLARAPSLLGREDYAVLGAAALSLAFVAIALAPRGRRSGLLAPVAAVAGAAGVVLAGGLAGLLGSMLGAAGAIVLAARRRTLTLRRALAVGALLVAVGVGVALMRSGDITAFMRFLGVEQRQEAEEGEVQTYAHRTLLAYIGLRIFADHPLTGVGWQRSRAEAGYEPYLDDARERFPREPPRAFPSPEHRWGVHNAFLQAGADLGVLGLAAFLAVLVTAIWLGARTASRAPPGIALAAGAAVAWLLVAAGAWNARGIVAGIPLDALQWIAAGLAVAVRAGLEEH